MAVNAELRNLSHNGNTLYTDTWTGFDKNIFTKLDVEVAIHKLRERKMLEYVAMFVIMCGHDSEAYRKEWLYKKFICPFQAKIEQQRYHYRVTKNTGIDLYYPVQGDHILNAQRVQLELAEKYKRAFMEHHYDRKNSLLLSFLSQIRNTPHFYTPEMLRRAIIIHVCNWNVWDLQSAAGIEMLKEGLTPYEFVRKYNEENPFGLSGYYCLKKLTKVNMNLVCINDWDCEDLTGDILQTKHTKQNNSTEESIVLVYHGCGIFSPTKKITSLVECKVPISMLQLSIQVAREWCDKIASQSEFATVSNAVKVELEKIEHFMHIIYSKITKATNNNTVLGSRSVTDDTIHDIKGATDFTNIPPCIVEKVFVNDNWEVMHKCKMCRKCFTRRLNYIEHYKAEHMKRSYMCTECGSNYVNRCSLMRHIRKFHTEGCNDDSVKLICELCNATFTSTDTLATHQVHAHGKIKMWKCGKCNKTFAVKRYLTNHQTRCGKKIKGYHCEICPSSENKVFARKNQLRQHIYAVHSMKREHMCDVDGCKNIFTTKNNLLRHKTRAHTITT